MTDKVFMFFVECFETLANGAIRRNQVEFFKQVALKLSEQEYVDSAELVAIARSVEGKDFEEKTLCQRLDKLIVLLQEHKPTLSGLLAEHGLNHFPMIEKVPGGGNGQRNRFVLVLDEPPGDSISVLAQTTSVDVPQVVFYKLDHLSSTPWWLRHIAKHFANSQIRKTYVVLFLSQIIILPTLVLLLMLFKLVSFSTAVFVLVVIEILCWPLVQIGKLLVSKFVEIGWGDMSTFALSVITENSKGTSIDNAHRQLVTGVIRADCPICMQRYSVHSSIMVERRFYIVGRYVGRCIQNPTHIYSFDKDLMNGQRLNH